MNLVLALPGALFIGFSLGMFGSGGSILTVPILVYLLGQDEKVAIASSLAIVGLVALFGSLPNIRARLIDWRTVALFGIPGIAGTWLGAWGSAWVSGTVQLITFAVVMLLA
ncbi:MAG: sulfite exporter TauE/SafE family protein, partial [Pseudomonadales bacterium]|nr:sulfite exporter TauE/SafE family protein [Pseudomonadales bacterium]